VTLSEAKGMDIIMKSKFSDLLFNEITEERKQHIKEVLSQEKENIIRKVKLDRVTLFVTHKCNLFCTYCNGPHVNKSMPEELRKSMLQADMTLDLYNELMNDWKQHGLKYIHFTGGEATIHPEFPEYVRVATQNNIMTALTTNGVAESGVYEKLIENGLYEIRISIDEFDEQKYNEIVGVKNAYKRLIHNIENIVKLRDEKGKDIFLILNATVGIYNINKVRTIMENLLELKPDDIKFLVAAEQKDIVSNHTLKNDKEKLIEFVENNYPGKELLKDKIKHLFSYDNFGLNNSKSDVFMDKCYIPLTERTLDFRGIYPCSIYLRYNGEPIARTTDPFDKQQEKTMHFIEQNSCRQDDICINFCTRCTRNFNLYYNLKKETPDIGFESSQPEYCDIVVKKPNEKYINKAHRIYLDILRYSKIEQHPKLFMVLKSKYLPEDLNFLHFYFDSFKIKGYKIYELDNWNYISLFLYAKHKYEKTLPTTRFLVNQAHEIVFGEKGLLVIFNNIDYHLLKKMKTQFRNWFGKVHIRLTSTALDESIITIGNCCHSPDKNNLQYEWSVVDYFLHGKITE